MISLNDVLLAMSNIPVDDPIAEIWGRGLQSGYKIIEYTGSLPITITANGDALLDYRIYGADSGVGEPTENLFDLEKSEMNCYYDASGTKKNSNFHNTSDYIPVESGKTYMLSLTKVNTGFGIYINLWDDGKQFVTKLLSLVNPDGSYSFSSPINGYIRFNWLPKYTHNIMLTKGSTTPESYIPYGYKLPMTVMDNLASPLSQWVNGYVSTTGDIWQASSTNKEKSSDFIEVKQNTQYVFGIEGNEFPQGTNGCWVGVGIYRDDRTFINRNSTNRNSPFTFLTPSGAKYVRLSYRTYGELLEPILSEFSFSIPVYIGENQLDAGEYVSYGEQKIYRDVSGTLTPTDPPVPLPEIPTIDGETIIDYDGDPKPSQMYIKYKGKG